MWEASHGPGAGAIKANPHSRNGHSARSQISPVCICAPATFQARLSPGVNP